MHDATRVTLVSEAARYIVGERVAESSDCRVYICEDESTGRELLLQIAAEVHHNGGLERAAFLLKQLKQTSDEFETEHAKIEPDRLLSYDRLFPQLVDGFIAADQGKRRVNILAFTEVDDVRKMVPLSNLAAKDRLRISLPSSAWVMGRLLKLLGFAHGELITVRSMTGNNVLIEPSRHFALIFDWSSAQTHMSEIPSAERKDDIAGAAKAVFASIGGNPETGDFPHEVGDNRRYVELLWNLANRREGDAVRAHDQFYELVDQLWGHTFRLFETLPL